MYCKRHARVSREGRRSLAYFGSPYHSCTWQIVIIIKTARVAVPIYYNIYGSRWSSISTVLEGVRKKKKKCRIEIGFLYECVAERKNAVKLEIRRIYALYKIICLWVRIWSILIPAIHNNLLINKELKKKLSSNT